MKYVLRVCARPSESEEPSDAHERVLKHWPTMSPDLEMRVPPKLGALGTHISQFARIKKGSLAGPIVGDLHYRLRKNLRDDSAHDDWLDLRFDPRKVGYEAIARTWFPNACETFGAYLGGIEDDESGISDMRAIMGRPGWNPRMAVYRIPPVSYFDAEICRRAFRLTPSEMVFCLAGIAEDVRVIANGVFILGSSAVLNLQAAEDLRIKLTRAVKRNLEEP